jgi:hypothetical protein
MKLVASAAVAHFGSFETRKSGQAVRKKTLESEGNTKFERHFTSTFDKLVQLT